MNVIKKTVLTGIGGAFATDVWSFILKILGIHSHGLLLVGQSVISHLNLPSQGGLSDKAWWVGWAAHYCLAIMFAAIPAVMYRKKWLQKPTIFMALMTGFVTLLISLFILQPVLNFGVAFSRYAGQPVILLKVVLFHGVYSIGIYTTAWIITKPSTSVTTPNMAANEE